MISPEWFETPETGDVAVIACHFNPCGFRRPVANLVGFISDCRELGFPLYMAELTYNGAAPVLPECARVRNLTTSGPALFQKEALLNVAEKLVPERFRKIAWIDADVSFPAGLSNLSALLDFCRVAQLFSRAILTDSAGRPDSQTPGLIHGLRAGARFGFAHPGFAWAARRELWELCGGLFPLAVCGHGDTLAAQAFLDLGPSGPSGPWAESMSPAMLETFREWCCKVREFLPTGSIKRMVGNLKGDCWHRWHGTIARRAYNEKLALLSKVEPRHLSLETGVLEWTPAALAEIPDVIEAIAATFPSRLEDDAAT